jgi:hypothetical protein
MLLPLKTPTKKNQRGEKNQQKNSTIEKNDSKKTIDKENKK